jgi:dipeptidyl aminopeptidase/acylaminoacyl peptidase
MLRFAPLVLALAASLAAQAPTTARKALTFADVMRFGAIEEPSISEDGRWIAYAVVPDRGDGWLEVRNAGGTVEVSHRIERGRRPIFSPDGKWFAAAVDLRAVDRDKPAQEGDKDDKKPKPGAALMSTGGGLPVYRGDSVKQFAFSKDSAWFARLLEPAPSGDDKKDDPKKDAKKSKRRKGGELIVRELESGEETTILSVAEFAFDPTSKWLACALAEERGTGNRMVAYDLRSDGLGERELDAGAGASFTHPTWQKEAPVLAWVRSDEDDDGLCGPGELFVWDGAHPEAAERGVAGGARTPEGLVLPAKNTLRWSEDGARLFFGCQPAALAGLARQRAAEDKARKERKDEDFDPFDVEALLLERTVDVWHWNDPEIVSHQKKEWAARKDRTWLAVHHLDSGANVVLGSDAMPDVDANENARFALGRRTAPYRQRLTWDGSYHDLQLVDLRTGGGVTIVSENSQPASMSPRGGFTVYWRDGGWHLFDNETRTVRALTAELDVPFANEDHDYPSEPPGYGVAGWVEDDRAVLIYDKFDLWSFPTDGTAPLCLTAGEGRRERRMFRIVTLDPEQKAFAGGSALLLTGEHDVRKEQGFFRAHIGRAGVSALLDEPGRARFVAKAKKADRLLFTRERYDRFPDLWVATTELGDITRVSEVNPQVDEFAWGSAELIDWHSLDGTPLQGVVVKPGGYDPARRYPVIVYFYQLFSQRLHEWNQPVVNHRPCFPLYASNGYVVFLPDVRFEVGRPGLSATKCLVPGVQKLIELGIADPQAIGLHGHSWSGYQTAFVITQTDLFATAVAGAPVANMTSAYGGIRWSTGLARLFQYEKQQSRLGATLWDRRDLYIDNSPLFFADRIRTPLLIQFGDEDGAVPWTQGIELYLALRRLGKPCVFLQYRGEDHHLAKYPNKLDYAIKMKEWFDHWLKGAPAPEWIEQGVPYLGK